MKRVSRRIAATETPEFEPDDELKELVASKLDAELPRSHPEPPAWVRTTAEPGCELCPSCRGRGWCKWCRGSRRMLANPKQRCDACAGKGECMVCNGAGQLPDGDDALDDSNERGPA